VIICEIILHLLVTVQNYVTFFVLLFKFPLSSETKHKGGQCPIMWALIGRSDLAQSAHRVGGVAVEVGLIVVGLVSVQCQAVSVD